MAAGPGKTRSLPRRFRFELHELEWTAPDRLQVTGEFRGRAVLPAEVPVLAVRGPEGIHRLPAVPGTLSGAPAEGEVWRAEFAWEVAPAPFDTAVLEFGDDIAVELGAPKARDDAADQDAAAEDAEHAPATASPAGSVAQQLHMQTEIFAAQAAAREVRAEADRLRTALARATEDLESERARQAVDTDRYRRAVADVERVAREALVEEERAAEDLRTELEQTREALDARDAEIQRLREELEAAGSASSELEHARTEAQRARAESERLSGRIARIREALDDST